MTDLNKVNFMSKTRFDNLSVTNDDELYIVETDMAIDSEVVHNTGNESIAGNKTLSNNLTVTGTTTLNNTLSVSGQTTIGNNLRVTNNCIDITNIPITSDTYHFADIRAYGTDNVRIGGIRFYHSAEDEHILILHSTDNTNTYRTDLAVAYNNTTGKGYIRTNTTPEASNSTSLQYIPTIGWVNDPTLSTNVVHRTGGESIAGNKVFTEQPSITTGGTARVRSVLSNYELGGTAPSSNTYGGVQIRDKNGLEIGTIYTSIMSSGNTRSGLMVTAPISGESSKNQIYIEADSDGNFAAYAPTPPISNSTAATNISTTGWVNDPTKSTNVVHRSGDETIVGQKIFTSSTPLVIKNEGSLFGSTKKSSYFQYKESNNKVTGWVENAVNQEGSTLSSGVVTTRLWAKTYTDNTFTTEVNSSLDVVAKPDGTTYVTVPTPAATDNSTKVATTAYVNSKIQFVNSLPASPVNGVLYLIPE